MDNMTIILYFSILLFALILLNYKGVSNKSVLLFGVILVVIIVAINEVLMTATEPFYDGMSLTEIMQDIQKNPFEVTGSSLNDNINIIGSSLNKLLNISSDGIQQTALGTRYFFPIDTSGSSSCYLLGSDSVKVPKSGFMNEITESSDNSLLSSAINQLQSINDYDIQLSSLNVIANPQGDKCVKVMAITNQLTGSSDSAYVTLNEYLKNQRVLTRVNDVGSGSGSNSGSGTSGFTTLTDQYAKYSVDSDYDGFVIRMKDDYVTQFYFASISVVGLYMFYLLLNRQK